MAMTLLTEPFAYLFFQRAALATLALAVAAPLAGAWAIQRRLVYLTDALSHGVLAGVAAAALIGTSLMAGALLTAVVMAILIALLVVRVRVPEDSSIGIVGQGLFALGVLGLAFHQEPQALQHVLFGNPLTVSNTEVVVDLLLAVLIVAAVLWLKPLLSATTFDRQHARTVGLPVSLVDTGVVLGLAVVVVIGLSSVGVLMALTLSLAPAVAARLVCRRTTTLLACAVAGGVMAGMAGLLVSYHAALPTGPVVALLATAEVAVAGTISTLARGRAQRDTASLARAH